MKSPWLDASRTLKSDHNGSLILKDNFAIKVERIPNEELMSKEYQDFQESLYRCMAPFGLILKDKASDVGSVQNPKLLN